METLMSLGVAQDVAALKVSDIYSPPRVTATARLRPDLNITGLRAFDLNTPHPDGGQWDFCKSEHRKQNGKAYM